MPLDYEHIYIIFVNLEVLKVKFLTKAICFESLPPAPFSPPLMLEQPLVVFSQQPKLEKFEQKIKKAALYYNSKYKINIVVSVLKEISE